MTTNEKQQTAALATIFNLNLLSKQKNVDLNILAKDDSITTEEYSDKVDMFNNQATRHIISFLKEVGFEDVANEYEHILNLTNKP